MPGPQEPPAPASHDAARAHIRGSTLLLAGQVFAQVANLAAQVLLVRQLTKTAYGNFAFVLSIVAIAETVTTIGLRRGISQYLPIYDERGDRGRAAGLIVFAFALVLGLSLTAMLVLIGLRGTIAGSLSDRDAALGVIAVLSALVPLHSMEYLLDSVFAVFARPRAILARKYLYAPSMRLLVVVLFALTASGVVFVAWGFVITGVIGIAVYATLLLGVLRERGLTEPVRRRQLRFPVREVMSYSLPLITHDIAAVLLTAMGTVLLGILSTGAAVAEFRSVLPIATTLTYVLSTFGLMLTPSASRLRARGEGDQVHRVYWQTAAWTSMFSLPVFLIGFVFSTPLTVFLFGQRYAHAAAILAVLMVGYFATAALGPNATLLAVYDRVRFVVWTNVVGVIVNVVLSVVLINAYGAIGAAVAATATFVGLNLTWQLALSRMSDVRSFDRTYLPLYGLIVAATTVLGVISITLRPPLVVAVVLVLIAWFGVFLGAREGLAASETFGDLARLPILRRLLGMAGRQSAPAVPSASAQELTRATARGLTPEPGWLLAALPAGVRRVDPGGDPAITQALAEWGYVLTSADADVVIRVVERLDERVLDVVGEIATGRAIVIDERRAHVDVDVGRSAAGLARGATPASGLRAARVASRLRGEGHAVREITTGPRGVAYDIDERVPGRPPRPGHAVLIVDSEHSVADAALAAAAAAASGITLEAYGAQRILGSGVLLRTVRGADGRRLALRVAAGTGAQALLRAVAVTDELHASPDAAVSERIVSTLVRGTAGLAHYTLEPWVAGSTPRRLDAGLRDECLAFLEALARVPHGVERAGDLAVRDADQVATHASPEQRIVLARVAARLAAALGAVPCAWIHGDFWPGNLIVEHGRLAAVLDWDGATATGMPVADALHLIAMSDRVIRRLEHGGRCSEHLWPRARKDDPALRAVCTRLGVPDDPGTVEAFAVAYWLGRVARDLRMFADRRTRPSWMENNVWAPLAALEAAGW